MGGGSGGWNSIGNLRSLEEKARAALNEGKRNVFISFAMEDENEVNLLRGQAKNENSDIEFNDHSVREPYNSERAEYIKQKISERIARSSICVVYLSSNTAQSKWVEWEISKADELKKRIVAVHSRDGAPATTPAWIQKYNIKVVAWSDLSKELK